MPVLHCSRKVIYPFGRFVFILQKRWSAYKKAGQIEIDVIIKTLNQIFHLNLLGIPQDRIAKRLGIPRKTLFNHLAKMPAMAKWPNSDLSKGFSVPQVAQKHGWPEPLVWSQALNKKDDQSRFKELNWGIRTWD